MLRLIAVFALFSLVLLVSADAQGGSWQIVDSNQHTELSTFVFAIDCSSKDDCAAVVNVSFEFGSMIRTTRDGGNTWRTAYFDTIDAGPEIKKPLSHWDISVPDQEHIYVACDSGTVLKSRDGGQNWQQVRTEHNIRLQRIAMYDAMRGLAPVAGTYLLQTLDGWETWQSHHMEALLAAYKPDVPFFGIVDVAQPTPDILIALANYRDIRVIVRSTNGGDSWQTYQGPPHCRVLHFVNARDGWAVGSVLTGVGDLQRDVICHTSDGGMSWVVQLDREQAPALGLRSVHFADRLRGFAVGTLKKMWVTVDGGQTWKIAKDTVPIEQTVVNFLDIDYVSPRRAFLATSSGEIARYDGIMSSVTNLSKSPARIRVYPQPARDEMVIDLPHPWVKTTRIELHDILGNYFEPLTTQAGDRTLRIATSHLPAGVYVLHWLAAEYSHQQLIVIDR